MLTGVDVQHRVGEPGAAQVLEPGEGQRTAQAAAVLRRVDADDVDLADRLVAVVVAVVAVVVRRRRRRARAVPCSWA